MSVQLKITAFLCPADVSSDVDVSPNSEPEHSETDHSIVSGPSPAEKRKRSKQLCYKSTYFNVYILLLVNQSSVIAGSMHCGRAN